MRSWGAFFRQVTKDSDRFSKAELDNIRNRLPGEGNSESRLAPPAGVVRLPCESRAIAGGDLRARTTISPSDVQAAAAKAAGWSSPATASLVSPTTTWVSPGRRSRRASPWAHSMEVTAQHRLTSVCRIARPTTWLTIAGSPPSPGARRSAAP